MSYDNPIRATPEAVAAHICGVVERGIPDQVRRLLDLANQLLQRHALLRLQPVVSSEELVEAYFRCEITGALPDLYDLRATAIPSCINSSHKAVRRVCALPAHRHLSIEDDEWRRGWVAMQNEHPEVNVPGGLSPKRADLYLVAQGGVVSIEFKYVSAAGVVGLAATAAQVSHHASHHAEAVLVLYSATAVPHDVIEHLSRLTARSNVRILNPLGPSIEVARMPVYPK